MPKEIPNETFLTVVWYDRDLNIEYITEEFISCSWSYGINEAGACRILLDGSHPIIPLVAERDIVQLRRLPQLLSGGDDEWYGTLVSQKLLKDDSGNETYEFIFAGALAMLQWAIVAWPAGTTDRSEFTSTEVQDIIYDVIRYNLTALALASSGRVRDFDMTGQITMSPAPSSPASPTSIDYGCAWRNVYDVVIELCEAHGYEIRIKTLTSSDTQFNLELDYDGFGSDVTDEVILRPVDGAITSVNVNVLDQSEKTVAIVAGQGQESSRSTQVETSAAYNATHNSTELYVDARNAPDNQLTPIGDARLQQQQQVVRYSVQFSQSSSDYHFAMRTAGGFEDFVVGDTVQLDIGTEATPSFVDVKVISADFQIKAGEKEVVTLTLEQQ